MIAAGSTGQYPISGEEYFKQVTSAIGAILALSEAMGDLPPGMSDYHSSA